MRKNTKRWYYEDKMQKDEFVGGIIVSIIGLCLLTYGIFHILLDKNYFTSIPDGPIMLITSIPFFLFGMEMIANAICAFEITDQLVQVYTFSHSKKKKWSDFTIYGVANLGVTIGKFHEMIYPCYLISSNEEALKKILTVVKNREDEYGDNREFFPLFCAVRERKYRDIYVFPMESEIEDLLKKNNIARYMLRETS